MDSNGIKVVSRNFLVQEIGIDKELPNAKISKCERTNTEAENSDPLYSKYSVFKALIQYAKKWLNQKRTVSQEKMKGNPEQFVKTKIRMYLELPDDEIIRIWNDD